MSFFNKLRETLGERTRDNFCAGLQDLGINASLSARGLPEEKIKKKNRYRSLGLIDILDGPIRWVNVQDSSAFFDADPFRCVTYCILDLMITPTFPKVNLRSVSVKSPKFFGNIVRIDWKGKNFGLGLKDELAKHQWEELKWMGVDIEITARPEYRCGAISPCWSWMEGEEMSYQGIFGDLPSIQLWKCYQAIGQLLLTTSAG